MRPSILAAWTVSCLLTEFLCQTAHAQAVPRIVAPISQFERSALPGNIPADLAKVKDEGPVEQGVVIHHVMLMLRPSQEQQAALETLLTEIRDKASPNYHHWLSPTRYAARFGTADADVEVLTSWLKQSGLTDVQVSHTGRFVSFNGTATAIRAAFATELHRVILDGRSHIANIGPPSVPRAFADVVSAIIGLDDFPSRSFHRPTVGAVTPGTDVTIPSNFITPAAFAELYDLVPLQSAGIDGTGVTVVVVGQAKPNISDLNTFQNDFNLTPTSPQVLLATGNADPGTGMPGDLEEAALDLEWVSAVAPGATIVYDYAYNAVSQAMVDAIDNQRGQIVSVSFGDCETHIVDNGPSVPAAIESMVEAGNALGMTILAASGDQGAAACDNSGSIPVKGGLAVNFPASIPEVTAVGGTEFPAEFTAASASSYVGKETAWNDTLNLNPNLDLGHLAASGGGESNLFLEPAWQQTVPNFPSGGNRYVPDVALAASSSVAPYAIVSGGEVLPSGGTSAATPSWAGILALVEQYLSKQGIQPALGNANPLLYQLAQVTPVQGSVIFHDITSGSNLVPCEGLDCAAPAYTLGFKAGNGYDPVTGLGSVDADQLAMWSGFHEGTATLSVSPAGDTFLPQVTNTNSAPIAFTLSNNGNGLLTLSSVTFIGTNPNSFSIGSQNSGSDICVIPQRLFPGTSCTINVVFNPPAGGPQSALMVIDSDVAGSPTFVPLTGTGTTLTPNRSLPSFTQATGYGGGPIIQASDGNYYGVSAFGGSSALQGLCPGTSTTTGGGCGTIFKITPAGVPSTVYNFTGGSDGAFPSSLIQGPDGKLYGTALQGGSTAQCNTGCGTLFEIATTDTSLGFVYQFSPMAANGQSPTTLDGQNPSTLTLGSDGNIYGTSLGGGTNAAGTIFVFTPGSNNPPSILYNFLGGAAGSYPETLVQGSNELFYGMTQQAEQNADFGNIFQIDTSGNYRNLYTFENQTDSANIKRLEPKPEPVPYIVKTQPSHSQNPNILLNVYATPKALVQYSDGNFYGTTASPLGDKRTVFKITPAGALNTLYTFTSTSSFSGDGGGSLYGLTLGSDGNFYGTSGDFIFRMTSTGRLFSLYQLPQDDSGDPQPGGLLYASDGSFVDATTSYSQTAGSSTAAYCSSNCGYGFDYMPTPMLSAPVQVSLSSATIALGSSVGLTWRAPEAYSLTAQQCYAFLNGPSGAAGGGTWTGRQTGTLTGGVYQGATTITPTATGSYNYALTCGGTVSAFASLTVTVAEPNFTVSASPSPAALGAPITLTATVSNPFGTTPVPTGTVVISNGYIAFASGTLVNGVAKINTTAQDPDDPVGFPRASVTFQAIYTGDANFRNVGDVPVGISVNIPITSLQVTTLSAPSAILGAPYNTSLNAAGGTAPYSWSILSGSLPPGLTLNSTSGAITGTPTSAGSFQFTAQVTDSKGVTATNYPLPNNPLGISVFDNFGPLTLTFDPPTPGPGYTIDTVGVPYMAFLNSTGGVAEFYESIISGSLPPGLYLSTDAQGGFASGVISGTPTTAGTSTFTVQIRDSESPSASVSLPISITINPPFLSIPSLGVGLPQLLPDGSVGTPYSTRLTATGGAGGYTWSLVSGSLPSGLTLSSSGIISGVPSQVFYSSVQNWFMVQVTDAQANTAMSQVALAIDPALTPATASLPSGVVGSAYLVTLAASGGLPPDTWRLVSGTLPPGISLDSTTGVLSGSPTQSGSFPFIVLVSDSESSPSSTSLSFTLNVSPSFAITSPATLPVAPLSAPYSAAITVSGGLPGYRWSVASGALPTGLQLDPNSGLITGMANVAGAFVFAVQVTDAEVTPVSVSKIICIAVNTACPSGPYQFVPITPCRVVDTRTASGPFGGPELGAGASREFDLPQGSCGIPSTAAAYSLNVTVVPDNTLQYLTLWPSGTSQPKVYTLTSSDGGVKANAAIAAAGANGGVSVYVSDGSNVILDIDGYFIAAGTTSALAFYPLAPCRVDDTWNVSGPFGAPFFPSPSSSSFAFQLSSCGIPPSAQAYSANVTTVQDGALGPVTILPIGAGKTNAAIVPAGPSGAAAFFASHELFPSDATGLLILDINGYFAPPAVGGLSLYITSPCRILDTNSTSSAFTGVIPGGVQVEASMCALPAAAQAYVLNATTVSSGPLGYLTLWPDGASQPNLSTLNDYAGTMTSNMAIVPTTNGKIDAFSSNSTELILDTSGYFAP